MKLKKQLGTLSLAVIIAACSDNEVSTQAPTATQITTAPQATVADQAHNPELWPKDVYTIKKDPEVENRIAQILEKMSIEEKVGQIIQPEIKYASPDDVREYHIGSVLNGGGTYPNNDKFSKIEDWAALANEYYLASMDESDGKIGIPILWGSDAVHGHNNVVGGNVISTQHWPGRSK